MKKANKENPTTPIQELVKRFDQQKQLIAQENRSLEVRIFNQIEESHKSRLLFEHKQAQFKAKIAKLELQLAEQSKQTEESRLDLQKIEQQNLTTLQKIRDSMARQNQMQEHYDKVIRENRQNEIKIINLQKYNNDLKIQVSQTNEKYQLLAESVKKLEMNQQYLSQQREKLELNIQYLHNQIKKYQLSLQQLSNKYSNCKKKKKDIQAQSAQYISKLNTQMQELHTHQQKLYRQLSDLKSEKDQFQKKSMTQNTKIGFLNLQLTKKDQQLQNLQYDLEKIENNLKHKQADLTLKYSNLQAQHSECDKQLFQLQQQLNKSQEQLREALLAHEIAFQGMKDKLIFEVIQSGKSQAHAQQIMKKLDKHTEALRQSANKQGALSRMRDRQRALQEQIKILRQQKLKTQPGNKSAKIIQRAHPQIVQKARLQNHLSQFQVDLSLAKRQIDALKLDNNSLISKTQELKEQLSDRTQQLTIAQAQASKLQKFYVDQIKKCISQLQSFKERDIQSSELQKQQRETREILLLRVSNYQKKMKELVDGIQRKDALIESFKAQRKEAQQTIALLQEKLAKCSDDNDALKKAKQDCLRKQQLIQQYKLKFQTTKGDGQGIKAERDRLRRENQRLQKSLQRKGNYLQAVKGKYEKQMASIQKKLKNNSSHTKTVSNAMEQKLIQMKNQCSQFQKVLQHVAQILWVFLKNHKEKKLPITALPSKKKKIKRKVDLSASNTPPEIAETSNAKYWQATKVLGLKQNQIQEFLNPNIARSEEQQQLLRELWQKGDYQEFFEKGLEYLVQLVKL